MVLFYIILSTVLISLFSFIGVFLLSLRENTIQKIIYALVSLSIGGLMGGAFLHLMPEALEKFENNSTLLYILGGFLFFLVIEKVIHWRHCHKENCAEHAFAYMNLVGDSVHNFIDGIIIAASYIVSPAVGLASTAAIVLHEIPQEIGDFAVLIHGGIEKRKALFLNFATAITAILGGIFGFYFLTLANYVTPYLLALAAGGFIYIAASDLVPEIRKENDIKKTLINFIIILAGVMLMYFLKAIGIE